MDLEAGMQETQLLLFWGGFLGIFKARNIRQVPGEGHLWVVVGAGAGQGISQLCQECQE